LGRPYKAWRSTPARTMSTKYLPRNTQDEARAQEDIIGHGAEVEVPHTVDGHDETVAGLVALERLDAQVWHEGLAHDSAREDEADGRSCAAERDWKAGKARELEERVLVLMTYEATLTALTAIRHPAVLPGQVA
jgi:hypothetical protein